jgi:acyl-CoA thioester hydrolase
MAEQVFTHTRRVTYSECTIGNHVYYSRYLDLMEEARGEFFRALGMTFQQLHDAGTIFPVIEASIRYKAAARYDDVLRIEITMAEVARVRLIFRYRILNQRDELLVTATTSHACAGTDDKLKRVPEELTAKLAAHVRTDAA